MREHYTIQPSDVGQNSIKIGGRARILGIGGIMPCDIGKRVYDVGGILQIENEPQRAARLAEEEANAPITIAQFIQGAADIGRPFKFRATRIDARPDTSDGEWSREARHWRITITRDGRQMRIYYSQGSAHTETPTLEDVLDCIASDAAGVKNARGFEDWADEYGYDADSRKAERVYKACVRQADALFSLIADSDEYDRLLFNTERM